MGEERKRKPAVGLQPEGDVDWSAYHGVMVVVEQRGGVAKLVSWQLLGESRRLADKLETQLTALVIGHQVEHLAEEAIYYGADTVYLCDSPELQDYRTRPYSRICLHVIRTYKPEIVLMGATYTGRDLAGAIATLLPTGLTADSTQLDVDVENRLLLASRPAFSEKILATILCKQFKPQMATARAGVFQALPRDTSRRGEVVRVPPSATATNGSRGRPVQGLGQTVWPGKRLFWRSLTIRPHADDPIPLSTSYPSSPVMK